MAITVYRTVVFTLFVVLFSLFGTHSRRDDSRKDGGGRHAEIANTGIYEVLAWCVLIPAAFLPFFAMKEVERVFGVEKVRGMFWRGQGDRP